MSHQISNVVYHQGDDVPLRVTVDDGADPPVAVDISSAAPIEWGLFASADDLRVHAKLTKDLAGAAITITDGPNGIFEITLAAADLTQLAAGDYFHEAKITLAGVKGTVLTGTFTLKASGLD